MFEVSTEPVPANPPGVDVLLTRDDLWDGLVWKAEAPMRFAAGIVGCVVLERFDDGFLREIEHVAPDGTRQRAQERVILAPKQTVTFLRLSGGSVGRVVNEIVEHPTGELSVVFHSILAVAGVAHGRPEEQDHRAAVLRSYLSTWDAALLALRERRRTGLDPLAQLLQTVGP